MNNNASTPTTIPNYHFEQLKGIEGGYWWYEGRILWAKAFINDWMNGRRSDPLIYADLGCGTGGFGLAIQKAYSIPEAYLIDSNSDALEKIGPTDTAKVLTVDLGKDFTLPFAPTLVSCMDVIEHLKDEISFLKRVSACMAPGSLLVLSVPAHPFLYSKWDAQLGHFRRYPKSTLEKLVREAGFEICRSHYVWSFLFPAAPYRWISGRKQKKLEYPVTPQWLNKILIKAAQIECAISKWIGMPFGTSVMLSATKA